MKYLVLMSILSLLATTSHSEGLQTIELKNQMRFFNQKTEPENSLPVPLSEKKVIYLKFEVPTDKESTIKKLHNEFIVHEDLKARLEVYYFNQQAIRYLSQQLTIYKNDEVLAKCTSYFSLEQGFLVPGACSGLKDENLYGVSIFKN